MYEIHNKRLVVPDDILRSYTVALRQTCADESSILLGNISYNLAQFNLDALQESSRLDWFRQQTILINDKFQPVFAEVPTYTQMSYSFNLLDFDQLFNLNSNIPESQFVKNVTTYNGNTTNFIKNLKIKKGSHATFGMKVKKQAESPRECDANLFWIHPNDQTPRLTEFLEFVRVEYGVDVDIELVPEIIRTDRNLKPLAPAARECYFGGEKKLKYYKKYSMLNCVSECLSTYLIRKCGCIVTLEEPASANGYCSSLPKNETYVPCNIKYRVRFNALDIPSSPACSCLPTCDSVKYHIKYFHKFSTQSDEISINLRVNTEDAILFRRYQQFTFSDVVSYVGGLLGLFAGISMLSIVEIFYFFVIRVAVDVWRAVRGHR
ncbi:hypothetical protein ACKWTF_014327 [Chironomus riparius]